MKHTDLESALAKLRSPTGVVPFDVVVHELTADEASILLAKLEAAEELAGAVESYRLYDEVTVSLLDNALAAYRKAGDINAG